MKTTAAPMQYSAKTLRKCERLVRRIVPELQDLPLYIVNAPPTYPLVSQCNAFTPQGQLDNIIFDTIEEHIGWQGPGVTIVLCRGDAYRDKALGSSIHEACHGLGLSTTPALKSSHALKGFQHFDITARNHRRSVGDRPEMPAWYLSHGIDFVRRCLHLHRRAWDAGYPIGLPDISFAGWFYDLSPAWQYMRALGDETRRMRTATLAEIDAEPRPKRFLELFHADVGAWFDKQKRRDSIKPVTKEPNVSTT